MDLDDMRFVLCIARHQSLTRAAQELYVSQPTLTKCLQKLETRYNGKLFIRVDNRYFPTILGEQYLEYARKVLALEQQWTQHLAMVNSQAEGELNIAMPVMRSSCIIPRAVPAFYEKYPHFRLNIYEESSRVQERLLLDAKIDFAIFNEPHPHPKISYEPLAKEEVVLVTSPDRPAARQYHGDGCYPRIDLSDFASESFLLHFPEQNTGAIALDLFRQYGIEPSIILRTSSAENILRLVHCDIGIGIVADSYVKAIPFDRPLHCYSIGEDGVYSMLQIAYRKRETLSEWARAFIDIVKEYCL